MKNYIVKYKQVHWQSGMICTLVVLILFVSSVYAQSDVILPPIGGDGGGDFYARCPEGQLLAGMDLRTGRDIDAIRPICVTAYGVSKMGPRTAAGKWFGGNGGGPRQLVCPDFAPIVISMDVGGLGKDEVTVDAISLWCGTATTETQNLRESFDASFFVEDYFTRRGESGLFGIGSDPATRVDGLLRCRTGNVGVGIIGRSGIWLDALGLICGLPRILDDKPAPPPRPVQALGRVKLPPVSSDVPPRSICESARTARTRNSPAAPGLEARCAAETAALDLNGLAAKGLALAGTDPEIQDAALLQNAGPTRIGFYIGIAASEGQTLLGPGKQRIHDALPAGQGEGFNAAVTFNLLRNRKKIADLAPKGAALAEQDPLLAQLRSEQTSDAARKGFDIGVAAADGQPAMNDTITGIRATLRPDEQAGFDNAVSFSLARGKEKSTNAAYDRAPRGRALAKQDPLAAELRRQQLNDDYRMGFDVGMAAAEGQTAPGPGKERTRSLLAAGAEQTGFDSALVFSLERNRNANLAAVGATITDQDDIVAVLRNSERDVFYRLGFDIASGIFGDPKLGARGNTATGPGSLKVRDSLSAAGQRGFNAAVKLHLSRKY